MKRQWTDDMGEISGFGGSYEQACRAMVLAGADWLDAHSSADPKFVEYKGIFGIVEPRNRDAKHLLRAMHKAANRYARSIGCPDERATGAMTHAAVEHVMYIRANGWERYQRCMCSRDER